jgi:hypothetical protein
MIFNDATIMYNNVTFLQEKGLTFMVEIEALSYTRKN